jgi:hypothetical protein
MVEMAGNLIKNEQFVAGLSGDEVVDARLWHPEKR